MQIALTTGGLDFNGASLERGVVGGSETALICVARELAKLGHDIRVYCECSQPGVFDGVQYLPNKAFQQHNAFNNLDVHVSSRWPEFLAMKTPAALRVLWCHDVCPDTEERQWLGGMYQTDYMMLLSDYHIADYVAKQPKLEPHIWKTSNGVDLETIDANQAPKVPKKLIYTSRPERGLLYLLRDIMPEVIKRHPDAKLYHCCYDLSGAMELPPHIRYIHEECVRLSKSMPQNVIAMPGQTKASLYKHISSAELMVYSTDFPEISCISAMEAQACGTPIITTDGFALSETVGDSSGVKLAGSPKDPDYIRLFVEGVCELLDNDEARQFAAEAGRKYVEEQGYTWAAVAKSWADEFERRLTERIRLRPRDVVSQLVRNNDLKTAQLTADRHGCTDLTDFLTPVRPLVPQDRVLTEYRLAARGRFQYVAELLRVVGARPMRVLELGASAVSAGVAFAKWLPQAQIVVQAEDEAVRELLRAHAVRQDYENLEVVGGLGGTDVEPFDLILLPEVLEYEHSPHVRVRDLQNQFLKKNGLIAAITRFGTSQTTVRGIGQEWQPERLWNFDLRDLQSMFGEARDFNATFCSMDDAENTEVNAAGELQGYWCCVFRNGSSPARIPVQEKAKRTRPYQTIATCMIASNEEDWISGAIKSVMPVSDRVIVTLNNSTDHTERICQELGVTVRHTEFDNFAQVRNESKADVDADWIMWIDADERLAGVGNLRRYLTGAVFEGFAIRQNHLMLDLPGSYDLPVRVFRNRPEYQFLGYIHEHCEDTSEQPFDDPIMPTMMLPDVDIAHYGYLNERVRRFKCSARNMELLLRNVKDNGKKGRMLTWVLVIRDYLNMVKWHLERNKVIQPGSREHALLQAAVDTYIVKFENSGHRYDTLAFPMYQEALAFMGQFGLPCGGGPTPPFEVGLALFGAMGGLEDTAVDPKTQWFRDVLEYAKFHASQGEQLVDALGYRTPLFARDWDEYEVPAVELPEPARLLAGGMNVITSGAA
jgi:glycosyltransferase involved in cell wall biosynthesis